MNARRLAKAAYRWCTYPGRYLALGASRSGGAVRPIRAALISDSAAYTSEEQFHPFDLYRDELIRQPGLVSMR